MTDSSFVYMWILDFVFVLNGVEFVIWEFTQFEKILGALLSSTKNLLHLPCDLLQVKIIYEQIKKHWSQHRFLMDSASWENCHKPVSIQKKGFILLSCDYLIYS